MALRRFGKFNAASVLLTQRPAGLRNLLRETWRTKSLLGDGISVCIIDKLYFVRNEANRVKPYSALRRELKIHQSRQKVYCIGMKSRRCIQSTRCQDY